LLRIRTRAFARALTLALALIAAGSLQAEVTHSDAEGFTVRHTLATTAEPLTAWRTLTDHIERWWNPAHSWSGDATNLFISKANGGCFCERLPDGGYVEHLHIIYLAPGSEIRFSGALGPLQAMAVDGRMLWKIDATEGGSQITFTYHVFGHPEGGLGEIAPAVDAVIGEQLQRLGALLAPD